MSEKRSQPFFEPQDFCPVGIGGTRDADTSSTKLFVGNLPPLLKSHALFDFFRGYGEIREAVVIADRFRVRSRGYGFVTFVEKSSVDQVFAACPMHIESKELNIRLASEGEKPRRAHFQVKHGNNGHKLLAELSPNTKRRSDGRQTHDNFCMYRTANIQAIDAVSVDTIRAMAGELQLDASQMRQLEQASELQAHREVRLPLPTSGRGISQASPRLDERRHLRAAGGVDSWMESRRATRTRSTESGFRADGGSLRTDRFQAPRHVRRWSWRQEQQEQARRQEQARQRFPNRDIERDFEALCNQNFSRRQLRRAAVEESLRSDRLEPRALPRYVGRREAKEPESVDRSDFAYRRQHKGRRRGMGHQNGENRRLRKGSPRKGNSPRSKGRREGKKTRPETPQTRWRVKGSANQAKKAARRTHYDDARQ